MENTNNITKNECEMLNDYNETNELILQLDANNIIATARNLIEQQLENFPQFEVNDLNMESNRAFNYPARNIIASRAMINQIFNDTATYLLHLTANYIRKKTGLFAYHSQITSIGMYSSTLVLTDINYYLSDIINVNNINNIASTVIYSVMVTSNRDKYGRVYNDDSYIITNDLKEKLNDCINLLTAVLNCLGYFAHECKPLMFPNISIAFDHRNISDMIRP